MIYAQPNKQIEAILEGAPAGLAGVLGARIIDPPVGTLVVARTTAGITEIAPGVYTWTPAAPATAGSYLIVWDQPPSDPANTWTEQLQVNDLGAPLPPPPEGGATAVYANANDCVAYSAVAAETDADLLASELKQAERDIDSLLLVVFDNRDPTSGLKVDPSTLDAWKAAALNRATCAQTEYRLVMGPDFFIRAQHETVRGPDFATSGQLPHIGPKALRELAGTGLLAIQDGHSVRIGSSTLPRDLYLQTDLLP